MFDDNKRGGGGSPRNVAHLSSELRARFDELGGVGHETGILSFVSSQSCLSSHPYPTTVYLEQDRKAQERGSDRDAHASTAPAVAPAKRECKGFSFLEDMVDCSEVGGI